MKTNNKVLHAAALLIEMFKIEKQQSQNGDSRRPTPKSELATLLPIGTDYIEQIFSVLRSHHVVDSVRGLHGGFFIAMPGITLGDLDQMFDSNKSFPPLDDSLLSAFRVAEKAHQTVLEGIRVASLAEA